MLVHDLFAPGLYRLGAQVCLRRAVQRLDQYLGGPRIAGIIHRIAGIGLLCTFLYHQFYLLNLWRKKDLRLTVVPMPKDVMDLIQNFMYYLGLSREKPKFGKFTYLQKFDYWAVYWGMVIIGTSGLFLAFPVPASYLFPTWSLPWIWDTLFTMHSDEALLAIVFILFIHFYNEHLRSDVFPHELDVAYGQDKRGRAEAQAPA